LWAANCKGLLNTDPTKNKKKCPAKVVILGESGVGKTCLAMSLTHEGYNPFEPPLSTHGMETYQLDIVEEQDYDITLWDLGGQEEYRLLHRLFLADTTVALILFEPLRGKRGLDDAVYWRDLLLKHAPKNQPPLMFLVGTKVDRAGTDPYDTEFFLANDPTRDRLDTSAKKLGFVGYFPTSANESKGMQELKSALSVHMKSLVMPIVARSKEFQVIRGVIVNAKRRSGLFMSFGTLRDSSATRH